MLNSLKNQAKPAASVKSNYFARIGGEECTGCEICLDRCQMEAIAIKPNGDVKICEEFCRIEFFPQ